MYEGVFVAKCIKAHVDWSIKNLKVRTHAPHTRARAHARAHAHTHIARACTQAYGHSNDDPWFRDLEEMLTTGLTPQERVDNVVLAFEICRVRSVRLPVPSSGLAFMRECLQAGLPREGRRVDPSHAPAQAGRQAVKSQRGATKRNQNTLTHTQSSQLVYVPRQHGGQVCDGVPPNAPPAPPAQMPVSYFQVCGRSCRQSLSVIPKTLSGL